MSNILQKIVADKALEITALKQQYPLESFEHSLKPSERNFLQALTRTEQKPEAKFILECKKASPSKGLIRPDFNLTEILEGYQAYAACISVLTDEKYFQGSYDYLQFVTEQVDCPVLNKDFFIEPYQVYLARYFGADAILLMLSVLDDMQYQTLAEIAHKLNMTVLTEVSNESECQRAVALKAKLVGINNRNLRDLSTDLNQTKQLRPLLSHDCVVISESGIYSNHDVQQLAPMVDGFLVGSSLMAQANISLACRKLVYGEHKVCGLTTPENAEMVAQAGAVYGGLIFAEKSPRCVSIKSAQTICQQVPQLAYVGVFVNAELEQVIQYAEQLSLSSVQLHGNENAEYIATLRQQLPQHIEIWQAKAVVDNQLPDLTLAQGVNRIVLDSKQPGSGESFNWQLFNQQTELQHCMLAGGLSPMNIQDALALSKRHKLLGLDINSGAESSAGVKSAEKINAIFQKIRHY